LDEYAIIVENVSKSFKMDRPKGILGIIKPNNNSKRFLVLDKINFSIKKGEVIGIIGSNGSGKTTLLRTIAGVYKYDTGKIQINGKISPLLQLGTGFQEELDAKENIIANGLLLGISKSEIKKKINKIIEYAELQKFQDQKLKHYSSGMRARLGFSIAINLDPQILLVDEILSVGDKQFREKSYKSFLEFKNAKKTILIVTHNLKNILEICDRVILLNKGQMKGVGSPKEMLEKYSKLKST